MTHTYMPERGERRRVAYTECGTQHDTQSQAPCCSSGQRRVERPL